MSAWDISGAITWGMMAFVFAIGLMSATYAMVGGKAKYEDEITSIWWLMFFGFIFTLGPTVFCFSRLLGAHA